MITLITGVPGAGKTAYLVSRLLTGEFGKERPIYVLGVPDLALPHELLPPVEEWTVIEDRDGVVEHSFSFPHGSLIVIDEAQKVFRPRASSAKVPPYIQAFEKHRHLGLDFILLTQHPGLIDANIRKLTGKHIHIHQTWAGRDLLEWSSVADPNSKTDRSSAVKKSYSLPKAAFDHYKSAEIHTKQKLRIPFQAYLFVFLLLGVVAGFFFMKSRIFPAPAPAPVASVVQQEDGHPVQTSAPAHNLDLSPDAFVPRLSMRPETAPVYDSVRTVSSMPTLKGCINMRGQCKCYTDQATDAGLDHQQCQAWLEHPYYQMFAMVGDKSDRGSTPNHSLQAGTHSAM